MQASSHVVSSSKVKDDLKSISGIGPGLESRLNAAGIYTYAQLASCTPEYLTKLFSGLTGMSLQAIQKKNLIGQASHKVSEAREPVSYEGPMNVEEQQHYATFVTTLLLNNDHFVRQTRVNYVQGENDISWPGWNPDRLVDFIQDNARLTMAKPQEPHTPARFVASNAGKAVSSESKLSGTVQVGKVSIWPKDSAQSQALFLAGAPYRITLGLDLSDFSITEKEKIGYLATVYASKLGSNVQLVIGEIQGELHPTPQVILNIEGRQIPHGDYRLSTYVVMYPAGKDQRDVHRLSAWTEGSLLQVN
jgi:hypothetical protein